MERGRQMIVLLLGLGCAVVCLPACEIGAVRDAAVTDDGGPGDAAWDAGSLSDSGPVPDLAPPDISVGVDAIGSAATLELATWNLKEFPLQSDQTVAVVAGIIHDMQLDLIAVEEIGDMRAFSRLLSALEGFDGVLTPQDTIMRTGLIFRSAQLSVSDRQALFEGDPNFPRAPFQARVVASAAAGQGTYAFTVIVVHLKAGTEDTDRAMRVAACQTLKEHTDTLRGQGEDVLLLGDFNTQITSHTDNALAPYLDDTSYTFLTRDLAAAGVASLPLYDILIDHLIVADLGARDYAGAQVRVVDLHHQIDGYSDLVSDHIPVVAVLVPSTWR